MRVHFSQTVILLSAGLLRDSLRLNLSEQAYRSQRIIDKPQGRPKWQITEAEQVPAAKMHTFFALLTDFRVSGTVVIRQWMFWNYNPVSSDSYEKLAPTDIICQTIVQHCRTSDLELTATCCVKLRLSLSTFKSRLKTRVLLLSAKYSTCLFCQRL